MSGYELDALELGDRVAAALAQSSCDCRLGAFCYLHAPEPADLPRGTPSGEFPGWMRTGRFQRSTDRRG